MPSRRISSEAGARGCSSRAACRVRGGSRPRRRAIASGVRGAASRLSLSIKVFFLEPIPFARFSSIVYEQTREACTGAAGKHHHATVMLNPRVPIEASTSSGNWCEKETVPGLERGDPRWPTVCDHCGAALLEEDLASRRSGEPLYRAPDGAEYTLRAAPVGAMWDAVWMHSHRVGPDGMFLVVRTPGGDWSVDDRASNCTMKDDDVHRCWVRHGDPRSGNVHVDKAGVTCAAGAGSIQCGPYHGFLQNGVLT